jgi:hypothetical protein
LSITITILLAVLTTAQPAEAGWKLRRAQAIAAAIWENPCAGNVRIGWKPLPVGQTANSFNDPACIVVFSTGEPIEWEPFCTAMIHEYGHLAGFRDPQNPSDPYHSHNPHSVMSASRFFSHTRMTGPDGRTRDEWDGTDRRCRDRGRPYLARAAD